MYDKRRARTIENIFYRRGSSTGTIYYCNSSLKDLNRSEYIFHFDGGRIHTRAHSGFAIYLFLTFYTALYRTNM